ncbi:hypothetical protein CVT26_000438 [Gymnopilus dilepis]|uniref:Uncharacterized protein n=1 Tax=Gymnopilus dilepis TaxID=231916 RepID=A0A409Y2D4_9AGAR|nr:hypothetical protein CVT26_000438 [Gymnopilus dilepis]
MAMNGIICFGCPVIFGVLFIAAIIEVRPMLFSGDKITNAPVQGCISAWLTAQFNGDHNNSPASEQTRVRYILFCSIWTVVVGGAYFIAFLLPVTGIITSQASRRIPSFYSSHGFYGSPLLLR